MISNPAQEDWWRRFYEETPFELHLLQPDPEHINSTVSFLWQKLGLETGMTVLDQCCGLGNISLPLAERGVKVVGVDLCSKYVDRANHFAAEGGLPARYFCADALEFMPDTPVDAAFNWWTSFGYSTRDSQNLLMLKRALAALKPGGYFCLDYPNIANVLQRNTTCEISRYEYQNAEVLELRETEYDLKNGLRRQKWTYVMGDGKQLVHDTSLKMYLPNTILSMLQEAGFESIEVYGGVSGSALDSASSRCISLARRPL